MRTPEYRARKSASSKAFWKQPGTRAEQSRRMLRVLADPKTKMKRASFEAFTKRSQARVRVWQNAESREKLKASLKRTFEDPAKAEKIKEQRKNTREKNATSRPQKAARPPPTKEVLEERAARNRMYKQNYKKRKAEKEGRPPPGAPGNRSEARKRVWERPMFRENACKLQQSIFGDPARSAEICQKRLATRRSRAAAGARSPELRPAPDALQAGDAPCHAPATQTVTGTEM